MDRRNFLKGLLAVSGGIVIPSTKFIFDYGANSYKSSTSRDMWEELNLETKHVLDSFAYENRLYLYGEPQKVIISYNDVIANSEWEFKQEPFPVGYFGGILRSS